MSISHTGMNLNGFPAFDNAAAVVPDDTDTRANALPGTISRHRISRVLAVTDFAAVIGLAPAVYAFSRNEMTFTGFAENLSLVVLAAVMLVNALMLGGVYRRRNLLHLSHSVPRIGSAWCVIAAVAVLLAFYENRVTEALIGPGVLWVAVVPLTLVASRLVLAALSERWALEGRLGRRIALIGDPNMIRRLHSNLMSSDENVVHVTGLYCDDAALDTGVIPDFGVLNGDCDTLIRDLRQHTVDAVLVALPDSQPERLLQIRSRLAEVPVDVQLSLGDQTPPVSEQDIGELAGVPVVAVAERPLRGWRSILKEIEDRTIGLAIVIGISPILLLIAIAIKLDSRGPVLFKQPRTGYNNRTIEVYKFRTMYVDQSDAQGARLTERDDPRITRLGRILRNWSLDELPQFFNVLSGEMSIVGPRPHALSAKAGGKLYRDAAPGYDARHRVKPGITGLAQISGWRGPTETERQIRKRVEHDLLYIENWSFWLDIKIIIATAFTGFKSENAF